ncbi:MAG TPA: TerC/Alx family metal homeostasis membrane protein [Puia sp.]|jgi:tellurite resistance protein TerC
MDTSSIAYLVFGIVLLLAVILDLGLLSRKGSVVTIKKALFQTAIWVLLGLAFAVFLRLEKGATVALEYVGAYLMEWSLSIDNIFVFILIFTFFGIKPVYYGRVLMIGILLAILLRIIFITVGIAAVTQIHWLLYVFGAFLVYTGIVMFRSKGNKDRNLEDNGAYKFLKRFLPLTTDDGDGRWVIRENGKKRYTALFVTVLMLASTDIVFAVDSIPAVFGITQDRLVIYTSNIFAVLGLRSLFFLLQGAVAKFRYLPQGIAVVLVFVGLKMLSEFFLPPLPIYVSLLVIVVCLGVSIFYSRYSPEK